MRPSLFSGGPDPLVAANWVHDMEDILAVLSCTDEQKVLFATFKLTGEAKRWWRLARLSAKAVEFLHLTQGSLIVQQYMARIIELSQFAPFLVPDEERKVRKFEEGLRQSLLERVIGFQAQTVAEVVDRAAVIESGLQRGTAAQSQGKRLAPSDV
ncbi:uncharacterized protein LOC131158445 [Malania oleifera]|uniref:uncharacterized protein LOC131158445 n=1 Tax=Malania oleifera TaxID=397392 RepID=UPI0025ADAC52|nr:uncharacterized protein LOC131158445 [Malania oleifera]